MSALRWALVPLLALSVGCATAVRTPEKWREEVEPQVKERIPALRSCYTQGVKGGWVPRGARVQVNLRLVTLNEQRSYSYFFYLTHSNWVPPSNINSTRLEKCISDALGSVSVHPAEDFNGRGAWSLVFDPNMLIGDHVVANP